MSKRALSPLARGVRKACVSMGIVVMAVLNSAPECGDTVVPASAESTITTFALTEWGPTFVGDTVYIAIDAKSGADTYVSNLKSTWSVGTPSVARLLSTQSGLTGPTGANCRGERVDCALFLITGEGSTNVTATATVGKTATGARPTASTTLVAAGAPTRVRLVGLPTQIRVGEVIPLKAQLETASGAVVTSRSVTLLTAALDPGIAAGSGDVGAGPVSLTGVTPGLARVRANLHPQVATRLGLTGAAFTDEVTIRVVGPASRVVVAPIPVVLRVGESRELTATVTDAAGTTLTGSTVSATSALPSQLSAVVATNGTITLTASSTGGLPQSTVRLTVTGSQGGTQTAPTTLDVVVLARVASVALTPAASSKQVGEQQAFTPAITYVTGATGTPAPVIEYTSSDPSKVSINAQGVATALVNTGSTPVAITATVEGFRSNVATMAVGPQRIAVTPVSATVASGGTRTLSVQELTPAGVVIGTVPNAQIQYSSSAVGVATVGADGVVTCAAGAGGSAVITATVRNTTLSATSSISCGAAQVPAFIVVAKRVNNSLLPTSAETVQQGSTVALEATVFDQANVPIIGAPVTWTSSNTGVAVVSSTGTVTAVAAGTANVVVSLNSNPTFKATVAITVPATVTSNVARIEIEPRDVRITAPAMQQYVVTYFNAAGARIAIESGGSLEWVSSNSAVADINGSTGLATGRTAGSTNINARYLRNGVLVAQATTGLTVAESGTAGNYGSVGFSIGGVTTRELRVAHGYTVQVIVRTPFGTQVTSGVTPPPNLEVISANPGVTIAPSEPPPGAPEGYYFSITVAAGATVGSTVQLRSTVTGASGTITLTIVP